MMGTMVCVGLILCAAISWMRRPFIASSMLPEAPSWEEMYPRPTKLPEATDRKLADLLSEYEKVLRDICPEIHATLQPGLSAEGLDALEAKHGIVLSDDIRALYSWKNGSSDDKQAFPFNRFVPLAEALEARELFREGPKDRNPEVEAVYHASLGFRYPWVGVLENGFGDGYFYDPERRDEGSCFFHTFHDEPGYTFYPSVGNYIEQMLELNRLGCLECDELGITERVDCNSHKQRQFVSRFAQEVD